MPVQIEGVVRLARDVERRLRVGVPESVRAAFLEELRSRVGQIEEYCAGVGLTPADLPGPSQRAYRRLRELAALAPEDLPAPDGSATVSEEPLTVRNVVATLNRVLGALSTVDPAATATLSLIRENVGTCVESVDEICEQTNRSPSALPTPSRQAYAMLSWLTLEGNLERYLDRRDAALAALHGAVARAGPGVRVADVLRGRGGQLRLRFQPGKQLYRLREQKGAPHLQLGLGYLAAGDDDLAVLAQVVIHGRGVAPSVLARHRDFADAEDYGAVEHELRVLVRGVGYQPRGRVRDLRVLFERLNDRLFAGRLSRPHLDWYTGHAKGRFGFYVSALDLVCLDTRLDDERVPEFVTEFVLYHELLHKEHGAVQRGRRRHAHTAAFRADERRYPRYAEAEVWLTAMARPGHGAVPSRKGGVRRRTTGPSST